MNETKKKTEAYLIDRFGNAISMIRTHLKSGPILYTFDSTIEGDPVNLCPGRLSRSKKHQKDALWADLERRQQEEDEALERSQREDINPYDNDEEVYINSTKPHRATLHLVEYPTSNI